MKKFLKTLSLFVLPIICSGLIMEVLLRRIPNDYQYKSDYLEKNSHSLKVLFLGSSHVFYGIDPRFIREKSFNAAYSSQSLDYDLKILKKYEDSWDSLKYIVVPVDYFSLYSRLETGIESWRIKNYTIYYKLLASTRISDYCEIFSNKLDLNLRRLNSFYLHKESARSCSKLGWGTEYTFKRKQNLVASGRKSAARHTIGDKEYFQENLQILKQIAEFASSKNISLILITSPAYHTYVQYLDRQQLAQTINAVNGICKLYKNVFYFNLLNDPQLKEEHFYDADHLDEYGARIFSAQIDSLIRQSGQTSTAGQENHDRYLASSDRVQREQQVTRWKKAAPNASVFVPEP